MSFIVIECHSGAEYAAIATDQDGNNLVFENRENADAKASDCQGGRVVEVCNQLKTAINAAFRNERQAFICRALSAL